MNRPHAESIFSTKQGRLSSMKIFFEGLSKNLGTDAKRDVGNVFSDESQAKIWKNHQFVILVVHHIVVDTGSL